MSNTHEEERSMPKAESHASGASSAPEDLDKPVEERVIDALKTVFDPEIPVNIYELGLVYEMTVDEAGNAKIVMTLTSPHCPVAESLPAEVEQKVRGVHGVHDVQLELTWEPPWGIEKMSEAARLTLGMV